MVRKGSARATPATGAAASGPPLVRSTELSPREAVCPVCFKGAASRQRGDITGGTGCKPVPERAHQGRTECFPCGKALEVSAAKVTRAGLEEEAGGKRCLHQGRTRRTGGPVQTTVPGIQSSPVTPAPEKPAMEGEALVPVVGSTSCPLPCCVLVRHSHGPLKCLYQLVGLCLKQTHALCLLHSRDGLPSCGSFGHSVPPLGPPRTRPSPRRSRGAPETPSLDAAVFSESHSCIPGSSCWAGRFAALGFWAKRCLPRETSPSSRKGGASLSRTEMQLHRDGRPRARTNRPSLPTAVGPGASVDT